MLEKYLEKMSDIYNSVDSILITDKNGMIEYSAVFDETDNTLKNEGFTGRFLLDVYPELTRQTSSHFRAMKTGKPIIEEQQTLTDINGKTSSFISNTYPIELDGKIVGAIEGVVMLSEDGNPVNKRGQRQKLSEKTLYSIEDFITCDEAMLAVKDKILMAADSDSAVILIGETGTGKEIAAQSIHSHSKRQGGPFISQNCSAIPQGLLEGILFGTVKGSYTGAEDRKGLFELADKGTLFLDELNSMDLGLQAKILKAVEDQKIRRLGEEKERKIDVRIVSAVNQETRTILERGLIRKDLYYRLGVIQIRLTPLRERKGDIPLLLQHFIQLYNEKQHRSIKGISSLAEEILRNYDWPGNVRELRNVVEYAFGMAKGDVITMRELKEEVLYDGQEEKEKSLRHEGEFRLEPGISLNEMVEQYERTLLIEAMSQTSNEAEASKLLKISRQSLHYKLMKYHLI